MSAEFASRGGASLGWLQGGAGRAVAAAAKRIILASAGRAREGRLQLTLPDGSRRAFGRQGPAAEMHIADERFFLLLLRRGEVGFGEGYQEGWWTSADPVALLEWAIANRATFNLNGHPLAQLAARQLRRAQSGRQNSLDGARRNIAAHYDLSNEFFAIFLDDTMTYSSAVFETVEQSLAEAQRNKYRRLADLARIGPDDHVLEIGCGWGGFARWAAETRGCRVTAITISQAQHDAARAMVAEAGLTDRVAIELRDYRTVHKTYDAIVSIEMLEAVGDEYFETFFAVCDRALTPGGAAAIQTITVPDDAFAAARDGANWMQTYIFPGGVLPSLARLQQALAATSLVVTQTEDIAAHYAETLRRWRAAFQGRLDDVRRMGFDARFQRTWDYYLALSEAGFRARATGDHQIALCKPA